MNYVLGIDAGGTKTVCLLADETGRIVSEARASAANLSKEGEAAVERTLRGVIDDAIAGRNVAPAAIGLGMAGVDRASDLATVRGIMGRLGYATRTVLANDALVALVAGAGDGPGVVMIAGTGSIVYGRNAANRAARAGGWGPILADEGSGYWIGRQALAAVMREADGRGPETALTAAVVAHFGVSKSVELGQRVYSPETTLASIAAVAPLVGRSQENGDAVAAGILARGADELVLAAGAAVRRLGMERERFPLFLSGGIFEGVPWLAAEITRRIPAIFPGASVQRLERLPAAGAVHLALAELAGGATLPEYL